MDEQAFDDLLELYRWRFGIDDPSLLDWTPEMRVRPRITDAPVRDARPNAPARNTVVFGPSGDALAHADRSIHVVVLDERPSEARQAEARRVARDAVVTLARDGTASARWLRDPAAGRVMVSVLVHTADAPGRLDGCLRSIFESTPVTAAIELVVADAGTTDEGAAVAGTWSRRLALRHLRTDPAAGAIAGANAGADAARGDVLVLVGDRVRAQPGWLRPLVRTLRDDPLVGVAGAKLVSDDGTLEAAGGVVFADGSVAGFGCGAPDPDGPMLGFVRVVHYVSADLLATRTGLFRRLGGIERRFRDGYEDVDYCLRVRASGRRVTYQPQSVVVCQGPAAAGPARELRTVFAKRWATPLAALPARPARLDGAAWDRLSRVA